MNDSPAWERVHALFDRIIELDSAKREALLADTAREDPALAAEVRSLLSAHLEASGFLAGPPGLESIRTLAPEDRLGPYRIVEETGRGGMGVVYRAVRDDADFQRDVAIKVIYPGLRSDEILKRFRAERQILAMLDHPNIARLIDGGTAPDGSPYLVMDFVAGAPILEFCDRRELSVEKRIELFLQVCDAVTFAHQRLVVHRDLKSDNILVTDDGSPRLLDFGIAKLLSPEGGGTAMTVTAPMQRMMTPDYASPEQVRGDPATLAGDVYSLGVILYELLSGARPHRFNTRTPEEILRVVLEEDPISPSAAVTRSADAEAARRRGQTTGRLKRRLSGDLDFVVLKALEKDPGRRYGSVDQLAQDLRRHLDGLPVVARDRSTAYLISRFVRRHRAAVVTTGLVLAALVVGLVGTIWQAGVASRERDRAQRRFNDVRSLAHSVIFDIHDAIAPLPGSTKAREILVTSALRYLDNLSHEVKGDLALQQEMAVAYSKIGDVQGRPMFANLGQSNEALQSYDKSLDLIRAVVAAQPESLNAVNNLVVVTQRRADLLATMGRRDEALKDETATKTFLEAELRKHPDNPMLLDDLCVSCGRLFDMKLALGDTAGAVVENAQNIELVERFFKKNPKDPGSRRGALIVYAKTADLKGMRGDRAGAVAAYRKSEALAREAVAALPNDTDASRDLSIVYGMYGLYLADLGELDSAVVVYGKGMDISESLAAADTNNALFKSDLAQGHFEYGTIRMKQRDYEGAIRDFRAAYDRFVRLAAADSGNADNRIYMARTCRRIGEASRARGKEFAAEWPRRKSEAVSWFERSRDLYRKLSGEGVLTGDEVHAADEVAGLLAALR